MSNSKHPHQHPSGSSPSHNAGRVDTLPPTVQKQVAADAAADMRGAPGQPGQPGAGNAASGKGSAAQSAADKKRAHYQKRFKKGKDDRQPGRAKAKKAKLQHNQKVRAGEPQMQADAVVQPSSDNMAVAGVQRGQAESANTTPSSAAASQAQKKNVVAENIELASSDVTANATANTTANATAKVTVVEESLAPVVHDKVAEATAVQGEQKQTLKQASTAPAATDSAVSTATPSKISEQSVTTGQNTDKATAKKISAGVVTQTITAIQPKPAAAQLKAPTSSSKAVEASSALGQQQLKDPSRSMTQATTNKPLTSVAGVATESQAVSSGASEVGAVTKVEQVTKITPLQPLSNKQPAVESAMTKKESSAGPAAVADAASPAKIVQTDARPTEVEKMTAVQVKPVQVKPTQVTPVQAGLSPDATAELEAAEAEVEAVAVNMAATGAAAAEVDTEADIETASATNNAGSVEAFDPNYDPKQPLHLPSRRVLANALRMLAVDAVQQANSGHPGMPMGMADIAEVLWRDFLCHNPADPNWINRDRFVLSNGHGSMLLYGLLHLTGYALSLQDLRQFRQLESITPGHPEHGLTPGVEASTGPLGQGLANAVGMAVAEAQLAAQFNQPGFDLIDHFTYVFAGDGCMMEGVSHEACALAATLGLGKLIVFWDDNGISIDGKVEGWFTENVAQRFTAYGWHVIEAVDGHRSQQVRNAINAAREEKQRPTLICCKTQIGYGAPSQVNTAFAHGNPLGAEEVSAVREQLRWPYEPFEIPPAVASAWDARGQGHRVQLVWQQTWQSYQQSYPKLAAQFERRTAGDLPAAWAKQQQQLLEEVQQQQTQLATRKASLQWLTQTAAMLPELIGGSADVSDSVCVRWPDAKVISKAKSIAATQQPGNFIHFGVREFAMCAMLTGLALHRGFIPFAGMYLVFSDYARSALRMAAQMHQRAIFVLSHDSLALGEDGPSHQPVEQLASLRMMPGVDVWRPADAAETAVAWRMAVERRDGPSCLVLTRQQVAPIARNAQQLADISRGAYIAYAPEHACQAVILSTGSEVQLAVAVAQDLSARGLAVQVVSMPCCEQFSRQDTAYQAQVLAPQLQKRIAIECGVSDYWHQYVGSQGKIFAVDCYGKSAPGAQLMDTFGFNQSALCSAIADYLQS